MNDHDKKVLNDKSIEVQVRLHYKQQCELFESYAREQGLEFF